MMTGGHVPVPILLGPVRCIGCEPGVPPSGATTFRDEVHYQYMVGGGATYTAWEKQRARSMLARKVFAAVGRSCQGELRVTNLKASAFDIYALVFAFYRVDVEVEAIAAVMPPEACAAPAAPKDGANAGEDKE